jgi:hypothetical protein
MLSEGFHNGGIFHFVGCFATLNSLLGNSFDVIKADHLGFDFTYCIRIFLDNEDTVRLYFVV